MNKISKLIVVSSVILVLSLSFLFLTVNKKMQIPYISSIIHSSISTVNNAIGRPTQFFSKQKESIADLIAAYDENKELKKQNIDLKNQLAEKDSLEKENESLRQSLSLAGTYGNKLFITGLVSSRTPTSWASRLMLDIGAKDGVKEGMLVAANGALIGLVDNVYSNATNVKLLSSSDQFTKIPVKILAGTSNIYGVLVGMIRIVLPLLSIN
ncbi:rod shape-determining protein MreC [Streptococcus marmotae]|uniref:rod shape-determining protein MreC n=1 Tax=Streptococcus marmotae TaxID=1825069 RepID=UPI00082E40E7